MKETSCSRLFVLWSKKCINSQTKHFHLTNVTRDDGIIEHIWPWLWPKGQRMLKVWYDQHVTRLWKHAEFRTYSFFVPVWPYSVSDRKCNPLIRYMGTSTEIQFSTLLSRINTKLPTPQNCDFHLIIFCMSIISGCLAYSEF